MTLLPPRPVRYVLAWAAAAVVAVVVGLLAVSLLGDGIGPTLATGATNPGTTPAATVASTTPGAAATRYVTAGGEVYGSCTAPGARPTVSGVPAAGWEVGTSDGGATVRFERGDQEFRIVVSCNGDGGVVFTPGSDDGGAVSSSSAAGGGSPSSTPSPTTSDDHGGGSGSSGGSGSGGGSGTSGGSGSGGSGDGSGGGSGGGHGADD